MTRALMTEVGLEKVEVLFCPGCEHWQLDYRLIDLADLVDWKADPHPSRGVLMSVDLSKVDECIEVILRDHVAHECPAPRRVMELWQKMQK